ncbi:YheV family putative zinc ribbon protein [Candidatus Enterovibrio altilux]|uniref:YheV family putative zinc ribbon protein n=1 Tax=Candidatus Enterovibrio altilux TaxID=1927128 RepID=UPI000BBC5484|nr:YheV family putative zinc ribbon protein [Candidatus Enterovibrio luxaltus]
MSKKYFIAGAICPLCQGSDTLRWWKDPHVKVIDCIKCGYLNRRSPLTEEKVEHISEDPDTRVIGVFKPQ